MSTALPPEKCAKENAELAAWTFLRYGVLGLILFSRVYRIRVGTKEHRDDAHYPYLAHPKLTDRMQRNRVPGVSWLVAGCIFVQSEGVGLTIYFAVSAMMDNVTIFFGSGAEFCETTIALSLYTMSLVTFLPNVLLGITLQHRYYDDGTFCSKVVFVSGMACITAVSFVVRVMLVYLAGYAGLVNRMLVSLTDLNGRVLLSVIVPPLVDAIQSIVLLKTGTARQHDESHDMEQPLLQARAPLAEVGGAGSAHVNGRYELQQAKLPEEPKVKFWYSQCEGQSRLYWYPGDDGGRPEGWYIDRDGHCMYYAQGGQRFIAGDWSVLPNNLGKPPGPAVQFH